MESGFGNSGFAGAPGPSTGVVVPIADQLHVGVGVAGPHAIPENVTLVSFYNVAAITVLTWPGTTDDDQFSITFQGDKPVAPTNPATRRVAGDNQVSVLGAGVAEIYISGATGRKIQVFKIKAGA